MGYGYQSIPAPPRRGQSAGKSRAAPAHYPLAPSETRLSSTGIAVPLAHGASTEEREHDPESYEMDGRRTGDGGDNLGARARDADQDMGPVEINRRMFNGASGGGKKPTGDDGISEGSDEEDQQIPLDDPEDDDDGEGAQQDGAEGAAFEEEEDDAGGQDSSYSRYLRVMAEKQRELNKLKSNTPLVRLRAREQQAEKCTLAQDVWTSLRLRQEVLGMAQLLTVTYRQGGSHPLLLAASHFRLAHAYFDVHYMNQTSEHAKRAMDALPAEDPEWKNVKRDELLRELHILCGESLLRHEPPKPQAALQHLMLAAGCPQEDVGSLPDAGLKALVSQCWGIMAHTTLRETEAVNEVRVSAEERAAWAEEELSKMGRVSVERSRMQDELTNARSQADAGLQQEAELCEVAAGQVTCAQDLITGVLGDVEKGLRDELLAAERGDEWDAVKRSNPLIATLCRRGAELMNLECRVFELRGGALGGSAPKKALKDMASNFNEILSIQSGYGCLPLGVVAQAHKDRGAALIRLKKYADALKQYEDLRDLQKERYEEDDPKRKVAEAEALKLTGDVYVAQKDFSSARFTFKAAQSLYSQALGEDSEPVQDLALRLEQLLAYTTGPGAVAVAASKAAAREADPSGDRDDDEGDDYNDV